MIAETLPKIEAYIKAEKEKIKKGGDKEKCWQKSMRRS